MDIGRIKDKQLIAFLLALIRRPEDLANIFSRLSQQNYGLYMFTMFLNFRDVIQKWPLCVDNKVLVTKDGSNLFSQLDNGKNVSLAILEKGNLGLNSLEQVRLPRQNC